MRNPEKFIARVCRMHIYVAVVINPRWRYSEMLTMICERLPNHVLKDIMRLPEKGYFSELRPFADYQLFLRKTFGERYIHEDRKAVNDNYREAEKRCGPQFRPRRGVLVGTGMAKV